MNYESWNVDLKSATAIHTSGFKLGVEGDLRNPTGVHPGPFPDDLSPVDQARLLRCGLEAMMKAAKARIQVVKDDGIAGTQVQHKPARAVLSLRRG